MNLRKDFNFWEKMKKKNEKKLLRIHFLIFPPELRKPSPPSPPGRVRGVLLRYIFQYLPFCRCRWNNRQNRSCGNRSISWFMRLCGQSCNPQVRVGGTEARDEGSKDCMDLEILNFRNIFNDFFTPLCWQKSFKINVSFFAAFPALQYFHKNYQHSFK